MNKSIIPKDIRKKIEELDTLNNDIDEWCKNNLDMTGKKSRYAIITDEAKGVKQRTIIGEEFKDSSVYEESNAGEYYWRLDNGKIYVFENDYIAFVKNVTKAEKAFLIKVDNIGKKKKTETFVICY